MHLQGGGESQPPGRGLLLRRSQVGRERRPRWVPGLGAFLGQQRPLQGTAGFHFSVLALSRRLPRLNSGEEAALRLFC